MSKLLSMTPLAAAAAALAFAATPAAAAPASPDKQAKASARIIKPLQLTWVQDLDLGDVMQAGSGPYTETVGIASDGTFTCGSGSGDVVCSGSPQVAMYNVAGTQGQQVTINSSAVIQLTHTDGATTLDLTVDNPGSLTLANSGAPGDDFALGGSIDVSDSTKDGVYSGTFDVTVEY